MTGRAKGRNGWHAGTVEVLPSGRVRWRVRVTYPDGTRERRGGTVRTKTEAQHAIITAQKEAQAGQRPASQTLTVGEMVAEYIAAKAASWAPRTLWNNEALFERHMRPHLGHLKAAGIDPRRLRAYWGTLSEARPDPQTGKTSPPLGYSGQRQLHVLLSGAYKRAIGDGLLRENPAQHARPVSPSKTAKKDGAGPVAGRVKHFSPEDLGRFIAAAWGDRDALPLAFLALTGMRIGEALGLTWGDVKPYPDAAGGHFVEVSKTRSEFQGRYYTGGGKSEGRRVPLWPEALAIVEEMRRRVKIEARAEGYRGAGLHDDAPLFAAVDGRAKRQDVLRAVMRRTCEAAGVALLSPHALRHSSGTYLISRGVDPVSVAALLGHKQVSTTLNIYAHALPDKLRGLAYGVADLRPPAKEEAAQAVAPGPRPARKVGTRGRKGGPRQG